MKIFVTGATGFIGSAVVNELLRGGHQVVGLARSDDNAKALTAAGAGVHRGDVQDHASLQAGVAASDATIHVGFIHDFSRYAEVCETDRQAIEAMGEVLGDKLLLVASGTALAKTIPVTETDRVQPGADAHPRAKTELAIDALAARGLKAGVVRFPPTVHGAGDHGFVYMLSELAKQTGKSAYVGDGSNRWPAVHRFDAAKLIRSAIEHSFAPGTRFHPVAEEGIAFRDIATVIGKHLNVPVVSLTPDEAAAHFTWLAHFVAMDRPASSAITRKALDWNPTEVGLLADIDAAYF